MQIRSKYFFLLFSFLFIVLGATAQTDIDGLVMEKKNLCIGVTHGVSSWKNYWEGLIKRNNLNLGTVSATNSMLMGNYGLSDRTNIIFSMAYVHTKASAGQLMPQLGMQDGALFLKYNFLEKKIKKADFNMYVITGFSSPLSNYTPDILPLSIGLKAKVATIRLLVDYENNHWTGTISGAFNYRTNVLLNRNTYYTTEMHYTNEVKMPNTTFVQLRAGYRSDIWIIEATADALRTLGGFDIEKNAMPFVSNKMNMTRIGINAKYNIPVVKGLSIVANANTVLTGRNVGVSTDINAGVFYIVNFNSKKKIAK